MPFGASLPIHYGLWALETNVMAGALENVPLFQQLTSQNPVGWFALQCINIGN